jgi:proteasome accessory factor A
MGGYRGERPIFVYGHWLGQFCAKSFLSLTSTRRMLSKLQRFQIGLSDSNLSDLAEYVKVGSVSLLLDMIEAGVTKDLPTVKQPIKSLQRITSDWNLVSRIPTSRGEMSAIEIQKAYWKAAAAYVASIPEHHRGEAPLVIDRWRQLLDAVTEFRQDARAVQQALGTVDWLTKRWMMDQVEDQADWSSRKKVDLRYHELSADGYYQQFIADHPELRLIDDDQIARRRRWPPATSPAARRGWLIREFADSDESMQAEWTYAMIGRGKNRKTVHFVETAEPSN